MEFIYNLCILIFILATRLLAPFNLKVKLWSDGRKKWESKLYDSIKSDAKNIWIHCASLGEFEQGRPLIEAIKKRRPEYRIILTFFSPSGYEVRKNYNYADYVCYLPADTPRNARKFISLINPSAAVFVKYEFWNNYISILQRNAIPVYLISGIFRQGQHFFKWYGAFFRKILFRFSHIFVQDSKSADLLRGIGIVNVSIAGDTRFDRVIKIADSAKEIPQIELFRKCEKLFLAGSSWRQDEEIIARYINTHPDKMKWIFAPHEIEKANILRLEKLLDTSVVKFSEFTLKKADARVLIIDNIGMLSSAYRYAFIAAIGGGFGKGIHNILEAACWGIPVIFGPNFKKFNEAVELTKLEGAKCFTSFEEFSAIVDKWLFDTRAYELSSHGAAEYVKGKAGATEKILGKIALKDINNGFS